MDKSARRVNLPLLGKQTAGKVRWNLAIALAATFMASLGFTAPTARAFLQPNQPSTTIVVDSLLDLPDPTPADGICNSDGGGCTLRAAIETAQGGAWPGPDTIDLSGLTGTIFMNFGVYPAISEDLTIDGPAVADSLTINATGEHQHLLILSGVTVEVNRVRLDNGLGGTGGSIDNAGTLSLTGVTVSNNFANEGGAIYNRGALTLSETIITDSTAWADGGGVYTAPGSSLIVRDGSSIGVGKIGGSNSAAYGGGIYNDEGSVTISDSTVTFNGATFNGGGIYNYGGDLSVESYSLVQENSAGDYGGGIYNVASGVVNVSNSTLARNTAWAGGGIYNYYSTQILTNSTVSRNIAETDGGGIAEESTDTLFLYNVTISENVADSNADGSGDGGGLWVSGFANVSNSIVAGNDDNTPATLSAIHPDCHFQPSTFLSTNTHNLVGINAGCETYFVDGVAGNQVGTPVNPLDPGMGFLDWDLNGAYLYALLAGSPAIDAGDPIGCQDALGALLPFDQRGIARPQNARCDIGAYEAAWPVVDDQSFSVAEFSANGTVVGTVVATDPNSTVPLSFAITGGNGTGAGAFGIGENSGELVVIDSTQLSYTTHPEFNLDVQVLNSIDLTDTAVVTVTVVPDLLVVRNTNDSGIGSLRLAMETAASNPGPDTITFDILGAGPHVITPTSPLPNIFAAVSIDASTQPSGTVVIDGSLAGPFAEADGTPEGGLPSGFSVYSLGTEIRDLTIRNFTGNGIRFGPIGRGSSPDSFHNIVENNTITGNGENGVLATDSQHVEIRSNAIYGNGLLGIDLGGDGVSPNDVGDPDTGPNLVQNYPIILSAEHAKGFWVEGRLNSLGNMDFTLDFFASVTCEPTGFGEGQHYLGSRSVATDVDGNARFGFGLPMPPQGSPFITATATDENGNTSEFSQCAVVGPRNDSWPRAYRLSVPANQPQSVSISQHIDKLGQSRWYKFEVEPDARVTVDLSSMPDNYDIILYRDIAAAFQDLITEDELVELQAEFAPEMYSPEMYSPEMYSPEMYSPEMYSPEMYSPEMYSPEMYSPEMYSPEMYSPDAQNPDNFSPDEHNPNAFDPNTYDPSVFVDNPQAYASAQNRSMITISAFGGTAPERIVANTWLSTGDFYVRVRGRNGTFNLSAPFTLDVNIQPGLCAGIDTSLPSSSTIPTAGGFKTIILIDPSRIEGTDTEIDAMLDKLEELKGDPQVQGVIVDVSLDTRVAAANVLADANPDCPYTKNLVAEAIKQIVTGYRNANPLEYIVLVGNDDVIPFFRTPDQAQLASESSYAPPVFNGTHSQSSLRLAYVLTQDAYGSSSALPFLSQEIAIPDLAVGRLVETPADVITMVDAFLSTTGGVVATPASAFVSGYDFLTDAAQGVQAELVAGLGGPIDTLIAPADMSPEDPAIWTADQLRAQLLGSRHDLIFLAGHFSAAGTLAADYKTRMVSQDVVSSTVNMLNSIVWSAGCHSGYNVVNSAGVPNVTGKPDWAQAFAMKGATLIAGTGYQYGDTDFVEYSERLYLEFTKHLRYGSGPVSLGKALVGAKQTYLETTPRLRGIHVKSVQQATLFGLPMLAVNLPFGRVEPPSNPPVVPGTSGYAANPGATLGLRSADLAVTPTLIEHTRQLSNTSNLSQLITVAYLEGGDGLAVNPTEPVLPLEIRNVDVPGYVLRGIGFRSGSYADQANVIPLTGAPATEVRGIHYPFRSKFFFPIRPWGANYFDALASTGDGATNMVVLPAQFQIDDPAGTSGTLRKYTAMGFRLFYSDNLATYGDNVPAQSAPPAIAQVETVTNTTSISFTVRMSADPSVGVQEVWVTYTGASGPFYGAWQSLDLAQSPLDSTLWQGTLTGVTESTSDVRFIVQAVNGVGLVTMMTNYGDYYLPGVDPVGSSEVGASTGLAMVIAPASAPYSSEVVFSARLTAEVPADGIVPLPDQEVSFAMGAQRRTALTDDNGVAAVTLPVVGLVGPDELRVSFEGTPQYRRSTLTHAFVVTKKSTEIEVLPVSANGQYSDPTDLRSKLTRGQNEGLSEKTLFFVVETPTGAAPGSVPAATELAESTITNYAGQAPAGSIPLPGGVYPITVYFMGTIPVGNGDTLFLEDVRYLASTGAGTLVQAPEDAIVSYTGQTAVASGAALDASAKVFQADDGSLGDLTLAAVDYVVRDGANQVVAAVTGPVTAGGNSNATIASLPDGSYTLTVQIVGGYFASPISQPIPIVVGTPNAVTLGNLSASGVEGDGWLRWLVALALPSLALAVWLRRQAGLRRRS